MTELNKVAAGLRLDDALQDAIESLGDAQESAERLRHIVGDLRIFSRASDGDPIGPTDVAPLLDSAIRMAWNEIRHRARLVKAYQTVPPVMANAARLGQVFLNLIVNAAQAIPAGDAAGHRIRVATALEPESGRVMVEVADSGTGIAPERLNRIFEAFYTTKPAGVGTGLGLSICHRIVTGFGGEITVRSDTGRGTVFRVLLPPAVGDVTVAAPTVAAPPPARRGQVLVIDDEPLIGRALARVIGVDHDVTLLSQAEHALERILAGERFDVILCDLMMPQMTGMALFAELQRIAGEQAERMIFLTGGAFTADARSFLATVPNLCIEKPFHSDVLRQHVNDRVRG